MLRKSASIGPTSRRRPSLVNNAVGQAISLASSSMRLRICASYGCVRYLDTVCRSHACRKRSVDEGCSATTLINRGLEDKMYIDNGLNQQVFELFISFSRLEYALTRVEGFARGNDGGPIYGDWKKLAEILGQEFFELQKSDPQKAILWNSPPGQWIVVLDASGKVLPVWRARQAPTELRLLLEPVAWVRNCVIHGESQDLVLRYVQLVKAAVAVLETIVETCMGREDLLEIAARYTDARLQEPGSPD